MFFFLGWVNRFLLKKNTCCRYQEAEEDCTKAIFLDSTYSKAFARRATARVALGKTQEAKQGAAQNIILQRQTTAVILLILKQFWAGSNCVCWYLSFPDFQEVLKLEPGNKQALNELQKLQIVCVKTHLCS